MNPAPVMLGGGLTTSRMGFGAMALTGVYGRSRHEDNVATINHALDVGVTFIDTADIYGDGESERTVGRVAQERRGEMTIATKVGIVRSADGRSVRAVNDAAYIRRAVDRSLQRLGTDTVDLLYPHRRDVTVPIEDVVGTLGEMVHAGKARYIGLSEVTAPELKAASAVHPVAAVQSEWSVWSRDVESLVVPAAAQLGIGFVPYSPLGRGFLSGEFTSADQLIDDWRSSFSRFRGAAFTANQLLVLCLKEVASKHGVTAAQIALAWLYMSAERYGLCVVPIPGTRKPARIDENVSAMDVVLDREDVAVIDSLASAVVGERCDLDDPNWTSQRRERRGTS